MKQEAHPELRQGEVFVTNSTKLGAEVGWKSKRVGDVAYCKDGTIFTEGRPVFASLKELQDAGIVLEEVNHA